MAKIAMATTKYTIIAKLNADGVVEKSDVVGAIFGQTEGLLGDDLELRELQRTGRIGRIEVNIETKNGKSSGTIEVPTSLSKEETALIAASVQTIDRIGPCEAKMVIDKVVDVREDKRKQLIDEAKNILRQMIDSGLPDSMEISESVKTGVRAKEIIEYGPEKLPAGPDIGLSNELIIVEGRADIVNLLRAGIKNTIAIEGTNVPKSVAELSRTKTCTAFLDGDRGGDLILKELLQVAKIASVARAPEGKEVEELTQKEILQGLRNSVPISESGDAHFAPRPVSKARGRFSKAEAPEAPSGGLFERIRSFGHPRAGPEAEARGPESGTQIVRARPGEGAEPESAGAERPFRHPRAGSDPDRRGGRPERGGRSGGRFGHSDRFGRPERGGRGGFRERRPFGGSREGGSFERHIPVTLDPEARTAYRTTLDRLAGSEEAELLSGFSSVERIPKRDLAQVLNNLGSTAIDSIVVDGEISQEIADAAAGKVKLIIGTHRAFRRAPAGVSVVTQRDL